MTDKKLTILIMTEYLPPQINGISTRCHNVITNFRKLGHTVHVAGPTDAPLTTIPMFDIPNFVYNIDNKFCLLDPSSIERIMQLLPTLDIVHVFYPSTTSGYMFPIFKLHNIPVICSHHCDTSQLKLSHPTINGVILEQIFDVYMMPFSSPLVSLNLVPGFTEENEKYRDALNLQIIPSGFDNKIFNHNNINLQDKSQSKILVYVGRLSREKNCDQMLDFFGRLVKKDKYKEYQLIVVGDGPIKSELEAKKIQNVTFVGYVEHDKVASYYKRAQAFVTFSISETFGFTNIEALACATPIIYPACKVFDNYYKRDFNKTRFNVTDYDSFERAVGNTYNNQSIQQKAIEYCKDKNWKSAALKLIEIYRSQITNDISQIDLV